MSKIHWLKEFAIEHKALYWKPEYAAKVNALIAIAKAAEKSLKLYDGDANAVIDKAVEAARKIK